MTTGISDLLIFEGGVFLRQRLILSCLSGIPIKIEGIRLNDGVPGIKDYEVNFIRLIDSISNGSKIVVNETGTMVKFTPGVLNGGSIEHNCCSARGIGYYLHPLFLIAPFCKKKLDLKLRGITNNAEDPTIDMIRLSLFPVMKKFLINEEGLSLKMISRGLPPGEGGVVNFTCPTRREVKPFQWLDSGKVKYIRGVAYTSRVAPTVGNRMLSACKEVFKKHLQDVYFTVDNAKGASPGFGLCAMAETHKGTIYVAECMSSDSSSDKSNSLEDFSLPENVGKEAANRLLHEIASGGVVDTMCQSLVLTLMVVGSKDISKVVLGMPTPYTTNLLRHLKKFFGVTFKIDEYEPSEFCEDDLRLGGKKYVFTCLGIGYSNISKPIL